ncbi:MAG: ATP-binding protein [Polyangia bacterium]
MSTRTEKPSGTRPVPAAAPSHAPELGQEPGRAPEPAAPEPDPEALHARWLAGNQEFLLAELSRVKRVLAQYSAAVQGGAAPDPAAARAQDGEQARALARISQRMPAPPALVALCQSLGLSPFERDVLLLCAGVELDAAVAAACAQVTGRPLCSFGLALAALGEAHFSALSPSAPLRRARLLELGAGEALTQSPLRIEERVLHFLTGVGGREERLQAVLRRVPVPDTGQAGEGAARDRMSASQQRAVQRLQELLTRSLLEEDASLRPLLWLCGPEPLELRAVAAAATFALGLPLYALRTQDVPTGAAERAALLALWTRELHLSEAALLLCCGDGDPAELLRGALTWLEAVPGVVLVAGREPATDLGRPLLTVDVPRPTSRERLQLLRAHLEGVALPAPLLEQAASQFRLGVTGLATAAAQVRARLGPEAAAGQQASPASTLWAACRGQARLRLDELARRIEPAVGWDDLVLPEAQRRLLGEVLIHQRQQATVYDRWGMGQGGAGARGLGITALFVGQSGTGKTLAAEVLAAELRLDLYHIDLSQIVSKYIGETEKNLRRVFDAAEQGGAVLLFDEADALFGKRSEVKDSHDRYANLEISYLLQRMEAYQGISVLTSNNRSALDSAFLRRIRFIVQFPFPDPQQRVELWRRAFGAGAPTRELVLEKLARLNITGGQIRNIALSAAFLAADEGQPVQMRHVLAAARSEYAKSERPLTEAEIGGWL